MTERRSFGVGLYTGQRVGGADYRDAVPLAVAAEEAGFDGFWVSEHHGWPDGYLPSPLTLLAALAPVTSRISLGTGLALAPLQHPLRLAEDAAVVDLLSEGRLILGLGLGYAADEYRAFGVDAATRGRRLDALVPALRTAWTGTPVSCGVLGIDDALVTPLPHRRIPIWLGGYASRAVRRAGELADGYLLGRGEPHIVTDTAGQLSTVRDPADPAFTYAVQLTCVLDGPDGGADSALRAFAAQQRGYERRQAGRAVYSGLVADPGTETDGLARGTVDAYVQARGDADTVVATLATVLADLRAWANVHVVLRVLFPEPDLDLQRRRLRTFGEQVLPRLRALDPEGCEVTA